VGGDNRYHCIFGGDGCYIVHPSDAAPALVALEATLRIAGPRGTRAIPLADLFVAPSKDPRRETALERGEVLTEVLLPPPVPGLRSSFRKVRARGAWDFALAGAALALRMEGAKVASARVVLAGAAPVPWRSKAAEQALEGKELGRETASAAAEAAVKGAEPLEHNGYKVALFRGLLEEELLRLATA
jgi:xanthine dehydrogenase YagS FAD-binding subunit